MKTYEEFLKESIDPIVRSKIVVELKKDNIVPEDDYVFIVPDTSTFYAKDLETAEKMKKSLEGKYRVKIQKEHTRKDGKIPMMITR